MNIQQEADKIIAKAKANGAAIVMIGLPIGYDTSADDPATRSPSTENKCSYCAATVQSTMLKDLVLSITKNWPEKHKPVILCGECLLKLKSAYYDEKVIIKGMYTIGKDE